MSTGKETDTLFSTMEKQSLLESHELLYIILQKKKQKNKQENKEHFNHLKWNIIIAKKIKVVGTSKLEAKIW